VKLFGHTVSHLLNVIYESLVKILCRKHKPRPGFIWILIIPIFSTTWAYAMWTSASSTGSRAARLIHTGRALARNGLREIAVRELKARGARAGKAEIRAGWWWRCWVFSR